MLHGSLNGFFHKSMATAAVSILELTCRWKRNRSGQRGVRIGPYAGVMVAVRSRGQALLWSCYVDLAHGIVWANRDYLLEFAGRSLQTGMPTWRAFTRGAVPGCAMLHCAIEASKTWLAAPGQTHRRRQRASLSRCDTRCRSWRRESRPLQLHTKTIKRGAASGLTIVASRQVAFNRRSNTRARRIP